MGRNEYFDGTQGKKIPGSLDNLRGLEHREQRNQEFTNTLIKSIKGNGNAPIWSPAVPETPAPQREHFSPSTSQSFLASDQGDAYGAKLASEPGFFDKLADLIKITVLLGFLAVFCVGGLLALYKNIGPEGFVLIGFYIMITAAAVGYAWLLYRIVAKAVKASFLCFIVWILSLTASAVVTLSVMNFFLP